MKKKRKRKTMICTFSAFVIALMVFATIPVVVAQQPTVSVNAPEEVTETFIATIDIDQVTNLDSGQFDLSFNASVVNVTDVKDGLIDSTTVPIAMWSFIDADTIRVLFDLPGVTGVSGSGYLAEIEFEVEETAEAGDTSVLDISNGLLVDTEANTIPANWTGDEVTVIKDITPPNTTITSGPTGTIDYNDVTFTWTGSDDITPTAQLEFSYKLDGSWSAWTFDTSKTYDDLSNGAYTFSVKARDLAGNEDPTPASISFTVSVTVRRGGGGGGAPRDSDGDGYTDIQEMLAGTDENDPCDPNPECAACLASKPAATPTPTAAPTAKPTTPPAPTPKPTAEPTPTEEPGFEAVFAIAGLLAVAYLVLRRKRK